MNSDFIEEIKCLLQQGVFPSAAFFPEDYLKEKKIIIYGAGSGLTTLSMFVLQRFNIVPVAVLDKKYTVPEEHDGTLYCHPDKFQSFSGICHDALVIISLGNPRIREMVKNELHSRGFRNVISAMDIYEYHLPNPSAEMAQGFSFFKNAQDEIIQTFDLLEDCKSREIFKQFLLTHIYRKLLPISSEPIENQYFPLDIWDESVYDRSIICGAYNGDTSLAILKRKSSVNSMICFEPDPENFNTMRGNISNFKRNIGELLLLPLALYNKNIQLRFAAGNTSNCTIAENGNLLVQCVTLDDCLPDTVPTFISMDIEGAELFALQGMKEIIRKHHPQLAVCVYHSPEHIWTIPLLLHTLVPKYKFYLRNYTSFTSETVLYAKY